MNQELSTKYKYSTKEIQELAQRFIGENYSLSWETWPQAVEIIELLLWKLGECTGVEPELAALVYHKFTPQEASLVLILYKTTRPMTKEGMHLLMRKPPMSDDTDLKIVDVIICKIRKKLPTNSVLTIWGIGYQMTDVGREYIAALLEKGLF